MWERKRDREAVLESTVCRMEARRPARHRTDNQEGERGKKYEKEKKKNTAKDKKIRERKKKKMREKQIDRSCSINHCLQDGSEEAWSPSTEQNDEGRNSFFISLCPLRLCLSLYPSLSLSCSLSALYY